MDSILDQQVNFSKNKNKNQIGEIFNEKEITLNEENPDENTKFKLKDRGTIESKKGQFN
jgi:hypothetical protein